MTHKGFSSHCSIPEEREKGRISPVFQKSNFWCERVNGSELTPLKHAVKNKKEADRRKSILLGYCLSIWETSPEHTLLPLLQLLVNVTHWYQDLWHIFVHSFLHHLGLFLILIFFTVLDFFKKNAACWNCNWPNRCVGGLSLVLQNHSWSWQARIDHGSPSTSHSELDENKMVLQPFGTHLLCRERSICILIWMVNSTKLS